MAITLWLAFYLFGKGFANRITLRTVVVLLALSGFFFGACKPAWTCSAAVSRPPAD